MPVHLRHRLRQERGGHAGLAVLDHAHQHRRHGHAQVQDSAGYVALVVVAVVVVVAVAVAGSQVGARQTSFSELQASLKGLLSCGNDISTGSVSCIITVELTVVWQWFRFHNL